MFGVSGVRVLAAGEVDGELHLLVETTEQVQGCRVCGVVALAHRRRERLLRDAPFGHRPVVVMWRKRVYRCAERLCPVSTFSEQHPLAGHRAALTRRAVTFETGGVSNGGTEAINGVIEKTRRLAHGYRNFTNYRLCECSSRETANDLTAEPDRQPRDHPQRRRAANA